MSRVVHVEFGAQDVDRAAEFYKKVFGWQMNSWGGPEKYILATTGPDSQPGINGGIMRHHDGAARTVCTIQVDSIESALQKIEDAGGKNVVPKMAVPTVGWLAYCTDTEGMLFGIFVPDESAK